MRTIPHTTRRKLNRRERLGVGVIIYALVIIAVMLAAGCLGPGKGYVKRDAIRPSVDAVTEKFDEMVDDAVSGGRMAPVEGQTWKGESALLRHLVSENPDAPIPAPAE